MPLVGIFKFFFLYKLFCFQISGHCKKYHFDRLLIISASMYLYSEWVIDYLVI